ncbi:uncharacterized protein J3D65DRAFT_655361 [Phyllosticta citribraziliensis]|uniref:Uncharacterized protein n=1 Tax=Phyllosticta citribraziliensis TaxID=989973 RepID=A0ABR1M2V5_9PEZI
MASLPGPSHHASFMSDSRPGSSHSTSTAATRPRRYCIVDHEGREIEPFELGKYGLRIQIEVESDVPSDVAPDERSGTQLHGPPGAQHLEHVDGSVPPAPPNTVESEKVPGRASKTNGAGAGNKMDDLGARGPHSSSPTTSAVKPSLGNPEAAVFEPDFGTFKPTFLFSSIHAPKDSASSPGTGDTQPSNPDRQYLANHRVSSYPGLSSTEQEQEDKNCVDPEHQQAESLSLATTTELEKDRIPSGPATPPAQTDSAIEGVSTALTAFEDCTQYVDPHDIFVEQLRMSAMEGLQIFDYEGYIAGTNEACIDLTRYVWQSGVQHGLGFASKIGPGNVRRPGHSCGGACDEVQKLRKELDKEKNNVKWEKWNVWAEKDKIKKLTVQHEAQVKELKDGNAEREDEFEKLKGDKKKLEDDKKELVGEREKLTREKMEQERRILLLMEQERENRARLNDLIMSMASQVESASLE